VSRPDLWLEAVRAARVLLATRRRTRGPHVRGWLEFRTETAYGDASAVPSGADLLAFLAWSRDERVAVSRMRRRAGRAR